MRYIKRIGNRGEIVLPKKIRSENKLFPKRKVEIIGTKQGILIVPLVSNLSELKGLFGKEGIKDLNKIEEMMFDILSEE